MVLSLVGDLDWFNTGLKLEVKIVFGRCIHSFVLLFETFSERNMSIWCLCLFAGVKGSAVLEAAGRGGGVGGSGSSRSSELINHTSFKTTASASCSSTPVSSSRVSSSISTEAQQEGFKTTGHSGGSTKQRNTNSINSNSSASARGGYTPPPSVTTTITTNAVTDETKRKTAAFVSEGKVNNNPVHDSSIRLSEGFKTKGLEQDSSSHQRMLARSNPGVHTIGGDMDSDTDPGLFNYTIIFINFLKSRILQSTIDLHNFSTTFSKRRKR